MTTTEAARQSTSVVQLAAVHAVYSVDRTATEFDILIATIVECLRTRPQTTKELLAASKEVWPGAGIQQHQVDGAVGLGKDLSLVSDLNDGRFQLTMVGAAEVERSRAWAEQTYSVTAGQLRAKASRGFGEISSDEARLWVGILATSLLQGIATSSSAYRGEIRQASRDSLAPASFDKDRLAASVRKMCDRPEVAAFLEAMALAALDPSDPFGNELVTSITTGYLLHAFLARRDASSVRNAVGSLTGTTVIMDTPTLFPLVGPNEMRQPVLDGLAAAETMGIDVIVPTHALDELEAVALRIDRYHLPKLNAALARGARPAMIMALVNEQLIELFLLCRDRGEVANWSGFRSRLAGLAEVLVQNGVEVVPHGNGPDDRVEELRDKLGSLLVERGRMRGDEEILRDANTMAMAARYRRDGTAETGVWPAAIILTTDLHMSIAYGRVLRDDRRPVTVSPTQWLSVLSIFADPATVEVLARSAATLMKQEIMLRVAARFPPEAAIEIASAIAPTDDASEVDVRLAQLSMDDLISHTEREQRDSRTLGPTIAARILERRTERLEGIRLQEQSRLAAEKAQLEVSKSEAIAAVGREKDLRRQAERVAESEREARQHLEHRQSSDLRLQTRQHVRVLVIFLLLLAIFVSTAVTGMSYIAGQISWLWATLTVGVVVSTVLFTLLSRKWSADVDEDWKAMLGGFLPVLIGVVGFIVDQLRAIPSLPAP